MRILDEAAVRQVFGVPEAMAGALRAFKALGTHCCDMPQRLAVRVLSNGGTHLSMPCYLGDEQGEVLTVKLATVFEGNRNKGLPTTQAWLAVYDTATGELSTMMDAEYLTAMRTAAASALASRFLAKEKPKTLGIFGTGGQAGAHAEVFLHEFPTINQVIVKARGPESEEDFCDKMRALYLADFTSQADPATGDIICLTTNSSTPLFDESALNPGTHINAIGAFRPDMREMNAITIASSRIFVDSIEAANRGAGDLIQAEKEGVWNWTQLGGELADLVLGRAPVRQNAEEITIFKSVGLAVQDAAAAAEALRAVGG